VAHPTDPPTASSSPTLVIGKYELRGRIASGGMATVHLGRLVGLAGFSRTVAIKRLHPHLAQDREFSSMFLDEARLAARVRHPNVVPVLDVLSADGEILIVMEYVRGVTLSSVIRAALTEGSRPGRGDSTHAAGVPLDVASAILTGVLHGLQAAHDAKDDTGRPLQIVHRDVSPQNVLIGLDGVARVLDFGVAKAEGRLQTTREGTVKGKLAYMPPEQLRGSVDRRTDVYSAGVVLWESLTLRRLFVGDGEAEILTALLTAEIPPPSRLAAHVPAALDAIVLKALSRSPEGRFASARDMALALEAAVPPAGATRVAEWVADLSGGALSRRAQDVLDLETQTGPTPISSDIGVQPLTNDGREPSTQATTALVDVQDAGDRKTRSKSPSLWLGLGAMTLLAAGVFALVRASSSSHDVPRDTPPTALPSSSASSATLSTGVSAAPSAPAAVTASAVASAATPAAQQSASAPAPDMKSGRGVADKAKSGPSVGSQGSKMRPEPKGTGELPARF
jgi:eukaryotic-like serine/threonine-protein kinase